MVDLWRLHVEHRTTFRYGAPVRASYNEARLVPRSTPWQTTLDSSVHADPASTTWRYTDYWGTVVTVFEVLEPHDTLTVTARSIVESTPGPTGTDVDWSAIDTDRFVELLTPTRRTEVDAAVVATARDLVGATPSETGYAVAAWVRDAVAYLPGSTGVQTDAMEALRQGAGVCQDIAHLTLGMLRSVGVPARYVSGYLHPADDAEVGVEYVGQSHAWVEWWSGEWVGYDPTNALVPGRQHVLVARGRDYPDVAPLKGIYSGGGPTTGLEVEVLVTRAA